MPISLEQLSKIRGVSFDELRVRSRQRFAKISDRLLRHRSPDMSDEELSNEFNPVWRDGSGECTADMLRYRLRARNRRFLPSLEQRRAIVEMMNQRFPAERDAIIKTAEAALAGRLSLLGYANLKFGAPPDSPIDWHLDPLSGKRAPRSHWSKLRPLDQTGEGDSNVIWEMNRHAHFVTLGQAYWLTNENRFAEGFVDQVSAWIDNNPVGMGINWASGLEVAFRSIAWLWALSLCVDSREVTPDFFARLLKSLIEHGRHIERYLSYYASPNTRLTGEALGLFYLGLALPELDRAKGWRNLGLQILLDQAPKQIHPDGVHFEQSTYYHRYTTDFYSHLFALTRANDIMIKRELEIMLWHKLESTLDHLMWITRPDGSSPLIGDDDGGRLIKLAPRAANDFRDTLAIGAAILKRGDWKYVAGKAPAELLWLIGPEGVACYDRLRAEAPREISREFMSSGYFVMRDGWRRDSSFVLIDCGPHGTEADAGHAHSDALSIEFASRGVSWLVDPGTFIYAADVKMRNEFRSTAAHNTVVVDGQSQSVPARPFSWRTVANCQLREFIEHSDAIFFQGSHDGYERLRDPVTHTRSVLFVKPDARDNLPEYLIVRDQFTAKKRHRYSILYHFAPDCDARIVSSGGVRVEARHATGAMLSIRVISETELLTDIAASVSESWVSTCYAQFAPAPVAVFEAEGVGTQEFLTLILPGAIDRIVGMEKQILKLWSSGADSANRRRLGIVKMPGSATTIGSR
jgi:Heparinase II/III-like protein/Heparinase II/III N-terminus